MKLLRFILSAGICCVLAAGCKQSSTQTTTTSNDDVVWKATISYCLSKEVTDSGLLRYGLEMESCNLYNFKVWEQSGNFHKLLNMFYDSSISKTYPVYSADLVTNLSPMGLMSASERERIIKRIDTVMDENGKLKVLRTDINSSFITGVIINHEFIYDSKNNTFQSPVTDASLRMRIPGSPYELYVSTMKFNTRANDSLGAEQEVLKPGVSWARDIIMPFSEDSASGASIYIWKKDSTRCVVNGMASERDELYPTVIKTTFNGKLVERFWNAARKGVLPAYYCVDGDKIGDQIPKKDVHDFGTMHDSVIDEKGNLLVLATPVTSSLLSGVELKEEIAFHQKSFSFESKITYVGVLVNVRSKDGLAIPNESKVLYWVKLN